MSDHNTSGNGKRLLAISFAVATLITTPALADIGDTICVIAEMAQGNIAQGIAILAVIALGIGAMLGKVSWGLAITVAVGIAIVFNAQAIVTDLGGTGTCGGVN